MRVEGHLRLPAATINCNIRERRELECGITPVGEYCPRDPKASEDRADGRGDCKHRRDYIVVDFKGDEC